MRSQSVTQQKKTTRPQSSKDVQSKKVVKPAPRVLIKESKRSSTPVLKKYKRYAKQGVKSLLLSPTFHVSFKIVTGLLISSSLLYGSYLYIGKTFANEVVISQSEIVSRVAKLTALPVEAPYEIVRVQDSETLRKQNSFYSDVEEGDYILMYKDVAVIYDLRANKVVAVKHSSETEVKR